MPREPINEKGPRCQWCGTRPDDPQWAEPAGQTKGIACLGCVADMRAYGVPVRLLTRVIYEEGA